MSGGGMVDADTPQLATEANNFDRIADELKAVMSSVEATGTALAANLAVEDGKAGPAAQAALSRFKEAALQQNTLLTEISQNIHVSSQQYESTDEQSSQSIQTAMNSVL